MASGRRPGGIACVAELARPDQLLARRVTQLIDIQERASTTPCCSHPVSRSSMQEEEQGFLLAFELEPFTLPDHERTFMRQKSRQAREHAIMGAGAATSELATHRVSRK